jgi:hypothetical protein
LVQQRFCSPNTQATALQALVLLFREFLGFDISNLGFNYAQRKPKIPIVISKEGAVAVVVVLTDFR